jgi:asparagine synthase (glutamine-hydrolysing)
MCGICGKYYVEADRKVSEAEIVMMRDRMTRRGPDDAGLYVKDNVAIGHRRLSIIDLEGSRQPLSNEDGAVWIVYNGEIYNYNELRNELLQKGHKFKTKGDTEVIVHLYEEYGKECVNRLRGMFAFAIWDSRDQSFLLARDRIGIKPLHYYFDGKVLLFASEIKSIIVDDTYCEHKEINLHALHHYFSFLSVPDPLSMFKGINKLLPGHMLIYKNRRVNIEKYWDVTYHGEGRLSEKQYCEALLEALKEAVRIRLISDVPLGAFLSGGIDSSSVVALMSNIVDQPVKTFSIGFRQGAYNEADDARIVARHFDTDHTEFILDPEDMIHGLNELILYFDEPFADSSAVPTFYVSKLAREKVTVVLSGDGGDELFGGYPWRHRRPAYQLALNRLPFCIRKGMRHLAEAIPVNGRGLNYLRKMDIPYERYIVDDKAVYSEEDRQHFYGEDLYNELRDADLYHYNLIYLRSSKGRQWMNRIMEYDLKTYLPNDILTKVDRMSMIHSLEARVPILDHKVVELAAGIPPSLKINRGTSKYIFKKTMENILPGEVLYKKKHGFNLPLEFWLRSRLKSDVTEMILDGMDHQYFDRVYVEEILKAFFEGDDRNKDKIWELYVFQLWYQRVFKGEFV